MESIDAGGGPGGVGAGEGAGSGAGAVADDFELDPTLSLDWIEVVMMARSKDDVNKNNDTDEEELWGLPPSASQYYGARRRSGAMSPISKGFDLTAAVAPLRMLGRGYYSDD